MPPATYIEEFMNPTQMLELATRATAKQMEEIPLAVLAFVSMAMGVSIKHRRNTKTGKSSYEAKSAIVERLMAAIHTRIEGITSGASAAAANATAVIAALAAATDDGATNVDFEWTDMSDGITIEVPLNTTVGDMVAMGMTELEDDGTGYVYSITVKVHKPGMHNPAVDGSDGGGGGGSESSDSTSDLALGVRGCCVVRVFASFSRCCVSCFLLPLCGVKLARPSGCEAVLALDVARCSACVLFVFHLISALTA